MTSTADRLRAAWWVGLGALVCIAIGAVTGYNPKYGLLAAVGLTCAGLFFADLTLGYALFVAVTFLDLASSSGSFSGTKVVGIVLFASFMAYVATRGRGRLIEFIARNRVIVLSVLGLLAWAVMSFAWAESPSAALSGASRYALDMILLPIAFVAVRERRHVRWVMAAFVVGAVVSDLYGFVHPTASTSSFSGRLTGSLGDPNAEATVLVAAFPLLIGLAPSIRRSPRMKLFALVAVVSIFAGLVTTLSREGLVAFAAILVAAVVFGGRWRRRAAYLLVIGVVLTAGYYFVFAPLAAKQRVTMADTSGRSSIWTVAWRITKAHPVLGVGNDNFIVVEGKYVNQPGAIQANFIVTAPKVVHNAYLESLVDLGIPGLLLYVTVLASSLFAAVRAARIFERIGDVEMELCARAVVMTLVVVIVSNMFVSGEYEKFRWILLSLCPVLLALARRAQSGASIETRAVG